MITESYRLMLQKYHDEHPRFGKHTTVNAEEIKRYCYAYDTQDVLDYGCGKGGLSERLGWDVQEYDPAVPGKEAPPEPADIVHCNQVLQHVEPEHLEAVLDNLNRCFRRVLILWFKHTDSIATWPDGRNATLIRESPVWWRARFEEHFPACTIDQEQVGSYLHFVIRREEEVPLDN